MILLFLIVAALLSIKGKCGKLSFDLKEPKGQWRLSCSCGRSILASNSEYIEDWDRRVNTFRQKHKPIRRKGI